MEKTEVANLIIGTSLPFYMLESNTFGCILTGGKITLFGADMESTQSVK